MKSAYLGDIDWNCGLTSEEVLYWNFQAFDFVAECIAKDEVLRDNFEITKEKIVNKEIHELSYSRSDETKVSILAMLRNLLFAVENCRVRIPDHIRNLIMLLQMEGKKLNEAREELLREDANVQRQ